MIRICNICQTTSDVSEFYPGVTSRCKECHKAKVRENRAAKAAYYREYDKNRFQSDPRVLARHKKYQATEAGKSSLRASREKWIELNRAKRLTHHAVNNAVRNGKIIKPKTCQDCGAGGRIHGHHEDYSKPLDVIWLCPRCHTARHDEIRQIK